MKKIHTKILENRQFCLDVNLLHFSHPKDYVQPLTQFPQLPLLQLFVSQLDKAPLWEPLPPTIPSKTACCSSVSSVASNKASMSDNFSFSFIAFNFRLRYFTKVGNSMNIIIFPFKKISY